MAHYFLDSSALAKRYRQELGSAWVLRLSPATDRLVISRLTEIEVTSALVRRASDPGAAPMPVANVLESFYREMRDHFQIVEMDGRLLSCAVELVRYYGLRAADAIQLASALLARPESREEDYYLVSSDLELNGAALSAGLRVFDPVVNA